MSATPIGKSPNITNVVTYQDINGEFSLGVGPINGSTSAALAVTLQQYFEFTVRPPAGSKLNLAALVFKARREQANNVGWVVRSSVDNYSTNLATTDIRPSFRRSRPLAFRSPRQASTASIQ